ncbi:hypothetical protein NNC19_20615 [Clostridium sp. SHJSY1]|uniref:hypothetical protein n=1 Tax=Clostridium sp. SHJSY1 TaxID=2942483 RepID=UPI002875B048|nr:hypothetical protein [Clostridium sp. SHJSY1]MDS0528101.1 hypothetical protein [Clostridium sp. SHJSY1]
MINDEIKLQGDNYDVFDKKQIALAIRNSNFEDEISCSILEQEILGSCENCSLKRICEGIENVLQEHKGRITKVVKSFEFN